MPRWSFPFSNAQRPHGISRVVIPSRAQFYEHGKWQHPHHFPLMMIISSTCIKGITEFPGRAYKYGGFAFWVIYFFLYFAFGLPMVILECQMGQYFGQSCFNIIRHICPIAGGIGIIQLLNMYLEIVKSVTTLSLITTYVFSSMVFTSPWRTCGHHWSSVNCYTKEQDNFCFKLNRYFWNNTCYEVKPLCEALKMAHFNETHCIGITTKELAYIPDILDPKNISPGKEYFEYLVSTKFTASIVIFAYSMVHYLLVWTLPYISVFNGLNVTGVRAAHFIFVAVNFILVFLFVSTILTSGGFEGVIYGFTVHLDHFLNFENWMYAFMEVIYNLNLGFATNTVLASYNQFNAHFIKDIVYNSLVQLALNQIMYSLYMYALWGAASLRIGEDPKYFSDQAFTNSAIISLIPDLYQRLPAPQLWATLFFTMITLRTVGANFIAIETMIVSFGDIWFFCRKHPKIVRLAISIFGCFLGYLVLLSDPMHLLSLISAIVYMDIEIMALIELLVFGLVYGFASDQKYRQFNDLNDMVGPNKKLYNYLRVAYYVFVPILTVVHIIAKYATLLPLIPTDFLEVAYVVLYLVKSPIILVLYALVILYKANREGKSMQSTITPTLNWYPQPITLEPVYKPKFTQGTGKYKMSLFVNKIGYEL